MSSNQADVKELASHEHQVLGSDFCSGYTDIFGKWNTGFDCPRMGNGETVYCCGTVTYKYCCTRREQHTNSNASQSVLIGSAVGCVLAFIVITIVSCVLCRKYAPYRRAHPSLNGGPLYVMNCDSTGSGMANLYSFSGQTTTTTTPLDTPHLLLDMNNPEHHIYAEPMNGHRGISRQLAQSDGCGTPTEPPPPYNEENPRIDTSQDSYPLQCSASQQRPPSNNNRRMNNGEEFPPENRQYWSTKF